MGPRQHPGGLVLVEAREAHEQPEHGTAKRVRQAGRVVGGPRDDVPSARKPPSVTSKWKCGCQLGREPCVCRHATIPTTKSRSLKRQYFRASLGSLSPKRYQALRSLVQTCCPASYRLVRPNLGIPREGQKGKRHSDLNCIRD